jgi:hypothetical protein
MKRKPEYQVVRQDCQQDLCRTGVKSRATKKRSDDAVGFEAK